MNFKNLILLALIVILLDGCHVPLTDIPPGNKEVEFSHDQYPRQTKFYIPKKLKKRKRSLVLCLHGEEETTESILRLTKRSFNILADQHGFIVGYPEGLYNYWNDAREDSISLSHYNEIDDVGFLEKVIDYAIDSFRVDPSRIFINGFSNGGLMTIRLACEIPSKVKGFAVVAASLTLDQLVECKSDTTISLMMINGTRDPIFPYQGGQIMVDDKAQGSVMATEEAVKFWLKENKCEEKATVKDIPNIDTFDETRSEKISYTNCENGNKIVLIRVNNGGHTWPGGRQYQNEKSIGKTSKDFNANEEIWRFFDSL